MRQHGAAVDIHLVRNAHVVPQHRHVLQARPLPDARVPSHDRALDPRVVLDLAVGQQHAPLQPDAVSNHHVRADGDVRPNAAILPDLGARVDQDVAAVDVGRRGRREGFGVLLRERRKVQARPRQKVLGLPHVHPEALEVEAVQLAVPANGRESLLLDARRPQLDAVQHARVQDIDAGVDAVAHELDGLLHEAVDARRVAFLVHHDAVFRGFFDLGHDDGAFLAVRLVELGELAEGVVADDVGVKDEEGRGVLAEGFGGELERAGGAEGFGLDGEFDADVVFFFVL